MIYYNPDRARKLYRAPDNLHQDRLKRSLMETAVRRKDAWGLEVAGRLSWIIDLVAEEALYHLRCRSQFESPVTNSEVGRPIDEERRLLFEKLCKWMDEVVEHGVTSLAEVHMKMIELDPTEDKRLAYGRSYLKKKLQEEYKESLYFTSDERREDIICLKDSTNAILREYRQLLITPLHTLDDAKLKELIISTAINLICGDMARVPLHPTQYPSVDSMTNTQSQLALIPDSLKHLLKTIVKTDEKVAVWGQNMLKAYRPRSGVMPFQLGLAIQLDHMFGSKWLIDHCHKLGYSESYAEVHRYKYCYLNLKNGLGSTNQDAICTDMNDGRALDLEEAEIDVLLSPEEPNESDDRMNEENQQINALCVPFDSTVQQCVGDNIDLNIVSLNGNTTFHAMGIIRVTSPATMTRQDELQTTIPRVNMTIEEKAATLKAAEVKILPFFPKKKVGLADIRLLPVGDLHHDSPSLKLGDIAWMAGWALKNFNPTFEHPNWNGFMKSIHQPKCKEKSFIEFLPIIEGDPNNYSTIYTTLMECMPSSQSPAVITFDLPIWLKATQIVLQSDLPIITRLGGFHLLKSFLCSIGAIMADSGLQELIQLVYPGSKTSEHILSGGAYAKAIRFHLLASAAITKFALRDVFSKKEYEEMEHFIRTIKDISSKDRPRIVTVFKERMEERLKTLADGGRTPALWVWYYNRIELIKTFIKSERVPDHTCHLSCIIDMLNTFAAAGHHHYAKGARLYVQLMQQRHDSLVFQETLSKFTVYGNHVVRFSDHEWSGTWTDITIETTLMREAKSSGGLNRGRFRNESAHRSWVQTLNHFSFIHQKFEGGINKPDVPIHTDVTRAQMKKDNDAVNAIVGWLDEVNPFDSTRDRKTLVSFSTGFSSTPGDSVNADKAEEVGRAMQAKMDGKTVLDAMEIKYKVKSLASFRSGPNVNGEKLVIDPLKLFNRLIIACEREVKIKEAMRFELTPTPMSLFDNNQMLRKPDKAALAKFLKAFVEPIEKPPSTSLVIDGGWLLHSISWEANVTWKDITESYLRFVKSIGSQHLRITVVFDGYSNSTKDHDHLRRTKKACCNILIRPDIKSIVPREKFLDNKHNKAQLILLLAEKFKKSGISVQQCSNDADTSIVRVALDEARESPVEVRAEDTDVMVMLIHHATNHTIFLTTAKDTSYDVRKIQEALPERYRKYLIFLHSFSGCDTVSAIYGFSKPALLTKLCKTDKAERAMDVFLDIRAVKGDIIKAGCELFKLIYRKNQPEDLEDIRFDIFSKRATAGSIKPERLPPTTGAATQHALRAYLQTRDWLLLQTPSLDVLEYGWKLGKQGYAPVPSTDPIAPDYLLKLVSCNCAGDCDTFRCGCKKQGVKCISACGNCHGNFCSNINHQDDMSSERDAGELDED